MSLLLNYAGLGVRHQQTLWGKAIMEQNKKEKSLGELFSGLAGETATLVRQEVQLAKTEMLQKAAVWGKGAVFLAAAGVLAFLASQALLAAAILALSNVVSAPLAALLVAVLLLIVAAVLGLKALSGIKAEGVAPKQTIESLREDAQWAKEQIP